MNLQSSPRASLETPTRVRFGVLGFACALSMITYLDRVCFGTVAPYVQTEFGLNDEQLGWLFTAFALAYAIFEVPSGWLGDVFGPRRTLIRIVLWWSLFTALTGTVVPIASWPSFAFIAMLAVRFLFGIGEAGAYPNIARAFHNWFPFTERGTAQGTVWMAGRFMGGATPLVVTALFMTTLIDRSPANKENLPVLCASTLGLMGAPHGQGALLATSALVPEVAITHWRHTFWIFGTLGLGWCLLFWLWFRDRPEQKATVNQAELDLIRGEGGVPEVKHASVPWVKLLSSLNLWSLCAMYSFASFGWYFNITWLPKYLKQEYGVTAESYGFWIFSFMAGAPLLFGSAACLTGGILTDRFIRKTGNRKWGRRLFGVVGHGICAVCYFLSAFARNPWFFVLAIAFAAFWNDMTMGSAWASCIDIGGKYSGIVSGCMNTIGNLGGAAAGYVTGWILKNYGWQTNFFLFAAVYVVATLCWLVFDSTMPIVPQAVATADPASPG